MRGLVQYTPDIPGLSWPPNAYSLFKLFMTTPVCRRELPMNQRAEASVPGFGHTSQHVDGLGWTRDVQEVDRRHL